MMSSFFSFRPDLTTLIVLSAALIIAPVLYFLYVRARLASGLRQGLNPNEVRMGGLALALATLGVLLAFSKTSGLFWSVSLITIAMIIGWVGRNRGTLILLLGGALVLSVAIILLRPAALQ